jgi:hypothetical protein
LLGKGGVLFLGSSGSFSLNNIKFSNCLTVNSNNGVEIFHDRRFILFLLILLILNESFMFLIYYYLSSSVVDWIEKVVDVCSDCTENCFINKDSLDLSSLYDGFCDVDCSSADLTGNNNLCNRQKYCAFISGTCENNPCLSGPGCLTGCLFDSSSGTCVYDVCSQFIVSECESHFYDDGSSCFNPSELSCITFPNNYCEEGSCSDDKYCINVSGTCQKTNCLGKNTMELCPDSCMFDGDMCISDDCAQFGDNDCSQYFDDYSCVGLSSSACVNVYKFCEKMDNSGFSSNCILPCHISDNNECIFNLCTLYDVYLFDFFLIFIFFNI